MRFRKQRIDLDELTIREARRLEREKTLSGDQLLEVIDKRSAAVLDGWEEFNKGLRGI